MVKLTPQHLSGGIRAKDLKLSHCQKGGIKSAHLMEEANDILELLNEQADLIWQWRARIFTLLTQKLSSKEGEQADGEEYARALDAQSEVEVYLQVLFQPHTTSTCRSKPLAGVLRLDRGPEGRTRGGAHCSCDP